MGMNAQLIAQAQKNLADAEAAELKANLDLQTAQMATTSASINFQYEEKTWMREQMIEAVFGICAALVQFGASIGEMCVGDEAGAISGAKAVEGATKAADSAANAAKSAADSVKLAEQIGKLADRMMTIKNVIKMLAKLYEALKTIIEVSSDLSDKKALPDASLPAAGDLSADPGWDIFVLDVTAVLQPAIDAKIPGAYDYLIAIQELALYGKAYMATQVSVVNIAQQLVQLQLQQQVNAKQADRLAALIADTTTTEQHFDELKQLFFAWELNMRFWVFTIVQQYAWAYRYWALRDSRILPSIVKTVGQLQQDLATVQQEYATALASFNPAPQAMPHQAFNIPTTDTGSFAGIVKTLRTTGTTTIPLPLELSQFRGLDRVRLTTVRVWLVGINASEEYPVNLKLTTSGVYADRIKGQSFQFATQPLTYGFIYNGAVGDPSGITIDGTVDEHDRYLYFQPTPFTQWTISAAAADNPGVDLSTLTSIRMEFAGSINRA